MKRDIAKFIKPYVVNDGKRFRLKDHDPSDTRWVRTKKELKDLLQEGVGRLCQLQERLYAQDRWGVLLVFQAMDAAGKDSAIKHVMSGVNPQGCQVYSFKAPSAEELESRLPVANDARRCPSAAGSASSTGPTTRRCSSSRVHPELLEQSAASAPAGHQDTSGRSGSRTSTPSNATCRATATSIRKFFLNVSKKEQKARFLARLDSRRQELEVRHGRRSRSATGGTTTRRLTRRRSVTPGRRTRRGSSCPPTTRSSRGSWSQPR